MTTRADRVQLLELYTGLVRKAFDMGDDAAMERRLDQLLDAVGRLGYEMMHEKQDAAASNSADALRAAMASALTVRPVDYVRKRDAAKARLASHPATAPICGCVQGEACMVCEYEKGAL